MGEEEEEEEGEEGWLGGSEHVQHRHRTSGKNYPFNSLLLEGKGGEIEMERKKAGYMEEKRLCVEVKRRKMKRKRRGRGGL